MGEFLARFTSAEITELHAYYQLKDEDDKAERNKQRGVR